MTYIKRWLEGGVIALLCVALVCVTTTTAPKVAKATIGPCYADIDCNVNEYCHQASGKCLDKSQLTCDHIVQGLSGGASVFAISAALFGVAPIPGSRLPAAIALILSATFAFSAWYVSVLCDN